MNELDFTVFIVDDDPAVRDSLSLLLGVHGHRTLIFASAETFLAAWQPGWRGCLLLDIRMPGMDGLALQKHLQEHHCHIPVLIMTGHGDVASAREAFRAQAVDFLEKPLDQERLLQGIRDAFARQEQALSAAKAQAQLDHRLGALTPRETEVMNLVVGGLHNREIATRLNISARTVEVHKARMMTKLDVNSVADLVRLSLQNPALTGVANPEAEGEVQD